MEVILIDDVYRLGRRGEVVNVNDGYGRNFLIPKKLAIPATAGNLKNIDLQRATMAKKETRYRDEAELLVSDLAQKHILISRKAGDTGVLFGSVGAKDIASALEASGIHLDRRKILLSAPVKTIGTITVSARPHADVEAQLMVSVMPETGEPISKVIDRGLESDQIIEALEQKVGEARADATAARQVDRAEKHPAEEVQAAPEPEAGDISEQGPEASAEAIDDPTEADAPDDDARAS